MPTVLITPETSRAMTARWRLCAWCGRPALKNKQWCKRHAPGRASDRRFIAPGKKAVQSAIARQHMFEVNAERMLPDVLKAWPPISRLLSDLPRHTRPVTVRHVLHCLIMLAMGDAEPWADCLWKLARHGYLQAGDEPWRV